MQDGITKEAQMIGKKKVEETGWRSKTVNETWGPKEGCLRITVEYDSTTRGMAERVQNGLAAMGLGFNK